MCATCFATSTKSQLVDEDGPFRWSKGEFCNAHYFQFGPLIVGLHNEPINEEWLKKGRFHLCSNDFVASSKGENKGVEYKRTPSYVWLIGERVEVMIYGNKPLEGSMEKSPMPSLIAIWKAALELVERTR